MPSVLAISLFAAGVAFLLYTYVGYPLAMRVLARFRKAPQEADPAPPPLPATVLLSARDAGGRLPEKIRELLALPPSDGLAKICVGLDGGGREAAVRLAAEIGDARVEVVGFDVPRGKAAVLADLMPRAATPVLVMVDVRQRIPAGAVGRLLRLLAGNPPVAVASGELVFGKPETSDGSAADSYWSFEKRLRAAESAVGSVPGATGALYAIRREAAVPPPPGTLDDDVLIPMRAVLAGGRCIFVGGAACYDVSETDLAAELRRKRRTAAGVWQLLRIEPRLLAPWRNPIFVQFLSHKVFRVCTPFACLLAYGALAGIWMPAFWGATALLGVSAVAAVLRPKVDHPLVTLAAAPLLLNWTLLLAAFTRPSWR